MTEVLQVPPIPTDFETPSPVPPWQQKNNERAKQLWEVLRKSVKSTTDLVKKSDIRPAVVSHGVHHIRKIGHDDAIVDVTYNSVMQEFVTVDHQFVRVFHEDGRRKDIIDTGEEIKRIVTCPHSNQYAALNKKDEIKLFTSDFEFVSTTKAIHKINCMMYNESTNEVVTAGTSNVMTWCFRYGNRYMIPHRVVTEGLTCKDEFDKITLENTTSHSQRCYAVCGTSVAVFNLHKAELICYKHDLHVRNITSILFFNPLKYIVTGSRDGSVKLWDDNFGIRLVFVGHHGPISSLSLYPQGPYIMSSSYDCTIRVWSLETCDEVDLIKLDEPVIGLSTTPNHSHLHSFSSYAVDLWSITHVHQLFTTIGNSVQNIHTASYNKLVDRVVCQSEDGTVRLLSPLNGAVLTTLVPPVEVLQSNPNSRVNSAASGQTPEDKLLLDAVYCLPRETIYAAYRGGAMVVGRTHTNPVTVKQIWKFTEGSQVNCMSLYEYILDVTELKQLWEESKKGNVARKKKTRIPRYGNKTILLVGRKDGFIASLDLDDGNILFETEAHGVKGVISVLSDARNDRVISAGRDNIVKVWKMFPNANEPLSLMMSFYCAHTPCHMTIAASKLTVAFQQLATATYTIVMYDLDTKERSDHSPHDDHTDEITGLSACPRLKLFASASRDGTIKVWSNGNELIRILKLNEEPKSIDFCNQHGDLMIGLGKNVHRVEHSSYLPRAYLFKMVCMEFPEPVHELAIPVDKARLGEMSKHDSLKVTTAKSSYIKMNYGWDPMTNEEQDQITQDERERAGAFALYAARDAELERIRDGSLKPKRADRRPSKRTESVAFKKYLALFWDRPKKVKIPDVDDFDPDPPLERVATPKVWEPETKIGFFPPIKAAKPVKHILDGGVEKDKHLHESGPDYGHNKFIINPCGFIPNSILIKLLWPQDEVMKLQEDVWKPPTFTEEQLEQMRKVEEAVKEEGKRSDIILAPLVSQGIKTPSDDVGEDETYFMGSDEDSEKIGEDFVEDEIVDPSAGVKTVKTHRPLGKVEKKPSALMQKMRQAMVTPPPPPKEPTPPPTPPPVKQEPKVKVPTRPSKPIVKFVSRPPPPKQPTPPPPTPPPPTPPPPTPPPSYLTQFEGLPWYTRHKDYITQRITQPYTAIQFFNVLCDIIGISIDWDHRCAIADALLLLWQQEGIKDHRHLVAALSSILNATVPPNPKEITQALFLRSAMKLYQTVNGESEGFLIEILTQYLESEQGHRNFIKNVLVEQGLQDPHSFLYKELESWEVWNLDETSSMKPQLRGMCQRWFDDWRARFKNHLDQTLDRLRRGDVRAKMRGKSKTSEGKRVQFEVDAGDAANRVLTSMEVLNYFCEMMLEDELERVRLANMKPEPTKNTVLVLPKLQGQQAIVRLGEMHTARRVRHRRELAAEFKVNPLNRPYPDLMAAFTNKLTFPIHSHHVNPFPCNVDKYDATEYQPILLTLKSPAQKYFIPERSFVHLE
nr:WD repeat-containing protein 97-like isoform X1 [Ciona intestinalis]|eukprot:XP_026692602.1 WD repeat-containing protein 97-like isoform X1 [Ciona intestinalis]